MAFLESFFPPTHPADGGGVTPETAYSRCLLIGPPTTGKSSLLFQYAFNRARQGLSTLYIICGARDHLLAQPPARPRVSAEPCTVYEDEAAHALQLIHIKHVATWSELRDVLAHLHMPEAMPEGVDVLPRGLIIDSLSSLFSPLREAAATASGRGSHQPTPSPSRPEQQRVTMFLALALSLAAHAADFLDSVAGRGTAQSATAAVPMGSGSADPGPELTTLLISCSTPAPEIEMGGRWLRTLLRVEPALSRGPGWYTLSSRIDGVSADDARVVYRYTPGRRLELFRDGIGFASSESTNPHLAFGSPFLGAGGSSMQRTPSHPTSRHPPASLPTGAGRSAAGNPRPSRASPVY
jgi:hypothetical protein